MVYKLYVHPRHRGRGLGLRLLDALTRQLPANADRLYIEHFVANERAGAFYEREGFTVDRIESSPTRQPCTRGGVAGTPAGCIRSNGWTSLTLHCPPTGGSPRDDPVDDPRTRFSSLKVLVFRDADPPTGVPVR